MMPVLCYTCRLVFDVDKKEDHRVVARHSMERHEMTLGF